MARRTVIAGAAWAIPAVALTTSTPAFATSTDFDLSFTTFKLQTENVGSNSGQPLYRAGNGPYLDFTVFNAGPGSSGSTSVELDFDANFVSSLIQLPSGWIQSTTYTSGGRYFAVLTYSGGGLATRSSAGGRLFFKVRDDAPYGTRQISVNGLVQPTSRDTNTSNNQASASFWTLQESNFDLDFTDFRVQRDGYGTYNNRPVYGPSAGPNLTVGIRNAGPAGVTNPSFVITFPANLVYAMANGPAGWTMTHDYVDGSLHVYRFGYSGTLGAGQTSGASLFRFNIVQAQNMPAGYTYAKVNGKVEPVDHGDGNTGNNYNSADFYTYR